MCVCFLGMVLLGPSHFQFNHFSFYLMGHKMSQKEKYIHHLYLGNYDNIGYLSREELRGRGRVMGGSFVFITYLSVLIDIRAIYMQYSKY